MPFYTYHCENCGTFETRQPINEAALETCPNCEGKVYQIFSPPTIIWKGRLKYMKFNPEVDMDKIEAEENRQILKEKKNKLSEALKEHGHKIPPAPELRAREI